MCLACSAPTARIRICHELVVAHPLSLSVDSPWRGAARLSSHKHLHAAPRRRCCARVVRTASPLQALAVGASAHTHMCMQRSPHAHATPRSSALRSRGNGAAIRHSKLGELFFSMEGEALAQTAAGWAIAGESDAGERRSVEGAAAMYNLAVSAALYRPVVAG